MGGGKSAAANAVFKRIGGVYVKPVLTSNQQVYKAARSIEGLAKESYASLNNKAEALQRLADRPLPKDGSELVPYIQATMRDGFINQETFDYDIYWDKQLYQKIISGEIPVKGGFMYQPRGKNESYIKKTLGMNPVQAILQIFPQLTAQNLREVRDAKLPSLPGGIPETGKFFMFETFVKGTDGKNHRTYVKFLTFHTDAGKPVSILVSLHGTTPMDNKATDADRGIYPQT